MNYSTRCSRTSSSKGSVIISLLCGWGTLPVFAPNRMPCARPRQLLPFAMAKQSLQRCALHEKESRPRRKITPDLGKPVLRQLDHRAADNLRIAEKLSRYPG